MVSLNSETVFQSATVKNEYVLRMDPEDVKNESVVVENGVNFDLLTDEQINELSGYVDQIVSVEGVNYKVIDEGGNIYLQVYNPDDENIEIAPVPNANVDDAILVSQVKNDPQKYDKQIIKLSRGDYRVTIDKKGEAQLQPYIGYRCPSSDCSKAFLNANSLTKHFLEVHKEKIFVCRKCPRVFEQLTDLFLHARRDHGDPAKLERDPATFRYKCDFPLCDYMTNNGGTFEHHRRAHTKEKPYACELCDKRFSQKTNRNTHQTRHNSEKIFPCTLCNKKFKTYDIFLSHLRTREHELREHSEYEINTSISVVCLGCNTTLSKLFDIKNHAKSCTIELDHHYQCRDCQDLLIVNLEDLKIHLKNHKESMLIRCPICGEGGFDHVNKLNHHITRTHELRVQRKHVCRYCESTFPELDELKEHVAAFHAGEVNSRKSRGAIGRYLCEEEGCDFTANTEMHMRSHRQKHERGLIGNNEPREPMKRGRKRKLPDTRDIFQQLYEDGEQKQEQPQYNTNVLDVKRKRGRPRKLELMKTEI